MTEDFLRRVAELVRFAGDSIVLTRFQALADHQITEKAPGEVVTVADRESEAWLTEQLSALLPGVRVIGEEACEARPELLDDIMEGRAWLIDPLDGTRNFAAGVPHFAIMVALVDAGVTKAGWIYHPLSKTMHWASAGGGAFVDGHQVRARHSNVRALRGALPRYYADRTGQEKLETLAKLIAEPLPGLMCAGEDYPRCVDGTQDFAVFSRSLPWDHAAGALFVQEAGGRVGWADGTPYSVGNVAPGLIAAASPDIWNWVARSLLQAEAGA